MVSDYAVQVHNVSKLYRIGARPPGKSFRETFSDLLSFRRERESTDSRDLWALKDVSFDVRAGEAIGIIGHNGAGKSTLLKILSRITEPTAGRIELRGRVSSLLEVGTGFHGELSGRENIQLNGAILGMSRKEIRERFDDIVTFAEVERFIDTPVKYYSTGMYMRLAFAVAAHLEPEILVVDEVLAVGDAAFQAKCLRKMEDVASHGRTVLFVSHNMLAIRSLCQRAVWLSRGKVEEIGDAEKVVSDYHNRVTPMAGSEDIDAVVAAIPPDSMFRLRRISVGQADERTLVVSNGQPVDIEIQYEVFAPIFGLNVYYTLHDREGTLLFECIPGADREALAITEPGSYSVSTSIPADFLVAVEYQLRFYATIYNRRMLIPEPVTVNLRVEGGGSVFRALPGYVTRGKLAPNFPWQIVRLDVSAEGER